MKRGKKLLALALALTSALSLLPCTALAAEDSPERGVLTYQEIIRPQYEAAQPFSEGLAAVRRNGKWGYIDDKNKTVIPFHYDLAYEFSEGLAVVGRLVKTDTRDNEVWDPEAKEYVKDGTTRSQYTYELGFLDRSGRAVWLVDSVSGGKDHYMQLVTDSQDIDDSSAYVFHSGYLVVPGSDRVRLFDTKGKRAALSRTETYRDEKGAVQTREVPLDLCPYPVNEGYAVTCQGYYDLKTGQIFDAAPAGEISDRQPFSHGLAPVWVRGGGGALSLGFIDTSGQWAIQPFPADTCWINGGRTSFRAFGETGLCMVSDRQKLFGAIDRTGQTVIPFQYENLLPASEGRIAFKRGGLCGYLDAATLEEAVPARYAEVTSFRGGLAAACDGTKAFLIDRKGEPVPGTDKLDPDIYFRPTLEGSLSYHAPTEHLVIQDQGKYGYGHVGYLPALPERSEMSSWAYEGVTAAIQADLIPVYLQNLYRRDITREEFCGAILQTVTRALDTDIETLVKSRTRKTLSDWQKTFPFKDTTDPDVIAAYALNIVSGRGDNVFDPYSSISRQEAAAFLERSAKVLRLKAPGDGEPPVFTDGGEIAEWAMGSVTFAAQTSIMSGTGGGRFSPLAPYSREQAFVTFYRLYQALERQ